MNKTKKRWLIAAACLMAVGLLVFLGAMAVFKFDFTKLNTEQYTENTYEEEEAFDKISVDVSETQVVFAPSNDGKCRVNCYERERVKYSVSVEQGTLIIDEVDTRRWYEHIGIQFGGKKMTVYLPEKEYASLMIDTSTGDVDIPNDFTFESIDITGDTSDVTCRASASGDITVKVSTGDVRLTDVNCANFFGESTTGSITLKQVAASACIDMKSNTGDVELECCDIEQLFVETDTGMISLKQVIASDCFHIKSDTGDVDFAGCDAAQIFVETDTGDVAGTLLSDKVFITETDTGDVDVPKTITGGRCEITTDTGNIEIDIR